MKTVLLIAATLIVDNVIKLAPGTPYDPNPGITLLQVSDATQVSPGQRLIEGSAPPAFEDVPEGEGDPRPTTIPEAVAAVEVARAEQAAAQANTDTAIDNLNRLASG